MRSSLIIILLLAAVCLGATSCPKGHKSIGGSASASTGASSGGGIPSAPGDYWDIGSGWRSYPTIKVGPFFGKIDGDQFRSSLQHTSSSVVRFGARLSPSERESDVAADAMSSSGDNLRLVKFDSLDSLNGHQISTYVDKSNYQKGYVLAEFNLSEPGIYGIQAWGELLCIERQ